MSNQSPAEDLRQQITSILLVFGADYSNASNADDVNWKAEAVSEARLPLMELVTAYAATVEREADRKARIEEAAKALESIIKPGYENYDRMEMQEYERVFSILYDRIAALQGPQDSDGK